MKKILLINPVYQIYAEDEYPDISRMKPQKRHYLTGKYFVDTIQTSRGCPHNRYEQKFLGKVDMDSMDALQTGSLTFEQRHNSKYRYSKLKGNTPLKALSGSNADLRFPTEDKPPKHRLDKPEEGKYHIVRLIRSDLKLNIFGERFPVPPEAKREYVVATIDVKEQKLKLFLDKIQIEEFDYKLR